MAAFPGKNFLLKEGPVASAVTVSGNRTTGMTLNNEEVNITDKDSNNFRELLAGAGEKSLSIAAAGIFKDSAAEETVRGYAFAGTINTFSLFFANGDTIEGPFQIASYERTGEHNASEEYSMTLESAGAWTFVAA